MGVYLEDDVVTVHHGDCIEVLRGLDSGSVDSIVTDPPYGIRFMGQAWDGSDIARRTQQGRDSSAGAPNGARGPHGGYRSASVEAGRYSRSIRDARAFQEWCAEWAEQALRILKPGGHLLAFGGARTWHRLACAVEDSGFEMRDSIAWLYGSGFPKNRDVARAVNARLRAGGEKTAASSAKWEGWGTALKPAFEPCIVARKPLCGTVADNVLANGVGAIHVDACRVPMSEEDAASINAKHAGMDVASYKRPTGTSLNLSTNPMPLQAARAHQSGRWPTNVVLDDHVAHALAAEAPELVSRQGKPRSAATSGAGWGMRATGAEYCDAGGPSRFFPVFRYEAKASTDERPSVGGVSHPTVKPVALMRWLVRLVTPYGGVVLDPFAGSGTTLEAAVAEGMRAIGVEREESYLPLIQERFARGIEAPLNLFSLDGEES